MKTHNLTWHQDSVSREDREKLLRQRGTVIWFTGLSGSGKSSLANGVALRLHALGNLVYVLDGDNVRHGLNKDLGFSEDDRSENIRRVGEVSKLFLDGGLIVLTAFISPFQKDRNHVRSLLPDGRFIEVYVKCSLDTCKSRDPKGLYKKAANGEIDNLTGISSPYEAPENPELTIENGEGRDLETNVELIVEMLRERKIIT